jgi:hypothetical protein
MPYLMALTDLHGNDVLFSSQLTRTAQIWETVVKLLDMAWDDDDAWECTQGQVPIRVLVADYRDYVNGHILSSRRFYFYTMDMQGSTLRRNCFDWVRNTLITSLRMKMSEIVLKQSRL